MKCTKYFLETFGCQMNILDSQLIEGQLRARGMSPVDNYREADLILFNTCSVRQHAEDKVYSRLGQVKGLKQSRPETIVGVLGCMAERVKEDLFVEAPHIDLICGPGELDRLSSMIDEVQECHGQVAALAQNHSRRIRVQERGSEDDALEALDLSRSPGIEGNVLQSYVRVQRGCDKFCTYCVVPFVRGPERSRPPANIIEETRRLVEHGCREVTLLGQTVNSYIYQENGKVISFANLLERVHEIEGLDRIRFVTSYPSDWNEEIFRVMRDYPRVMPYLHIPAQSGSDRILKAMRRTYTVDEYLSLMDLARKYMPDIALAGDFIVGFCGETELDYQQTVDLVRRVQYESLFIFKYSPRPGTKAQKTIEDDVPQAVKVRRNNELLAIQNEISAQRKQRMIGCELEVLVEGLSKAARKAQGEGNSQQRTRGKHSPSFGLKSDRKVVDTTGCQKLQMIGRSQGDLMAIFDAPPDCIGSIVRIRVESASPHTLFGEITGILSKPRAV